VNRIAQATRAIAATFAKRKVNDVWLPYLIGVVISLGIGGWLIHFSLWWFVLVIPILLALLVGASILIAAGFVVRVFTPEMTLEQTQAVEAYADKLQRVADNVQLPKFILLFRLVRDAFRPNENSFVRQVAHDSTSLKADFTALQKLF
jgi:hypothetical protein